MLFKRNRFGGEIKMKFGKFVEIGPSILNCRSRFSLGVVYEPSID